jgi:hypothetical protein
MYSITLFRAGRLAALLLLTLLGSCSSKTNVTPEAAGSSLLGKYTLATEYTHTPDLSPTIEVSYSKSKGYTLRVDGISHPARFSGDMIIVKYSDCTTYGYSTYAFTHWYEQAGRYTITMYDCYGSDHYGIYVRD